MYFLSVSPLSWLWLFCSGVAVIGCVYAVFASRLIRSQARRVAAGRQHTEAVTLLKPLYGAEPQLAANLLSFDRQDYTGPVQIICGTRLASDPAVGVVEGLANRTQNTFELATQAPDVGSNRKMSNVINIMKFCRHDIIVLSDSDMRVGETYITEVVAPFADPAVGLVTCLYRGLPVAGFWSRLHAASIDHHFLPNVLAGLKLGRAEPCFGSTIALRRETLRDIGGFEAFADKLADDYEIGRAVRALGQNVVIPPIVLLHTCAETSLRDVVLHELRWARTVRLVDPAGYAGSLVTHPLPMAIIAGIFDNFGPVSLGLLAATLACRSLVPIEMKRGLGAEGSSIAIGPLRDILSFAIFLASFLPLKVDWRGHSYRLRPDGTMI